MRLGLPAVEGVIDRRVLLNYRVEPEALASALPEPFEPLPANGWGIGGICLIRLRDVRPRGLPRYVGVGSENAAHRIAVTWLQDGEKQEGVYVPRRDTSSRLFSAAGGRLFSDRHHRATFDVDETGDRYDVTMESDDGSARVRVAGEEADELPADSAFDSLPAASAFFERGSLGMSDGSAGGTGDEYYALELRTREWSVSPLAVEAAESSYFEDVDRFPPDSVELDCALLMEGVDHEWYEGEPLGATG